VYRIIRLNHHFYMDVKDLAETKTAHPTRSIHSLITQRWSPYGFSDKPVPARDLAALFEAASWAASSFNEQPWRYLVAARSDDPDGFQKLLGLLTSANQEWAKHVPVLAVSVAKRTFTKTCKPNRVAVHDVGAASATLTFEATARGLVVHQMAGVDTNAAREALAVPEGFDVVAAIAIGYLDDPEDVDAERRERDSTPRTRKPLNEFVFAAEWERPAQL
jgi:nitroreductase